LFDEGAQVQHHRVHIRTMAELLVVDRPNEGARAALLLRELAHVAVARHAHHLEALDLDGLRKRAYAQAGGVLGAEVLVDDDDGTTECHGGRQLGDLLKNEKRNQHCRQLAVRQARSVRKSHGTPAYRRACWRRMWRWPDSAFA